MSLYLKIQVGADQRQALVDRLAGAPPYLGHPDSVRHISHSGSVMLTYEMPGVDSPFQVSRALRFAAIEGGMSFLAFTFRPGNFIRSLFAGTDFVFAETWGTDTDTPCVVVLESTKEPDPAEALNAKTYLGLKEKVEAKMKAAMPTCSPPDIYVQTLTPSSPRWGCSGAPQGRGTASRQHEVTSPLRTKPCQQPPTFTLGESVSVSKVSPVRCHLGCGTCFGNAAGPPSGGFAKYTPTKWPMPCPWFVSRHIGH